MPECYIRGNTIKYIRVPNDVGLLRLLLSSYPYDTHTHTSLYVS